MFFLFPSHDRADREREVPGWIADIHEGMPGRLQSELHFRRLSDAKKQYVCDHAPGLAARYFVVCSNKKNMRGYRNPLAEQVPAKNWFYCWMTRLLLERVTDFVAWHSTREHGECRKMKIEFSNRGGLSYSQLHAYHRWISYQGQNPFLKFGVVNWRAIDFDLYKIYTHQERGGLQLADVVASAFFKACDQFSTGSCNPEFARLLKPRMARYRDVASTAAGYGVKLIPGFTKANLRPEQKPIFRFYGYPRQWWAPDPSDP